MTDREKLKFCPFCGGKPKIMFFNRDISIRRYMVKCEGLMCDCKPETRTYDDVDKAIAAWNRRADNEQTEKDRHDQKADELENRQQEDRSV